MNSREKILKLDNSKINKSNQITPHSICEILPYNITLSTLSSSTNNSYYKSKKNKNENLIPNSLISKSSISQNSKKIIFFSPSYSIQKPSLNSQSSKKFILEYSQSKKYLEDKEFIKKEESEKLKEKEIKINNNKNNILNEAIDEYQELILNQEKNLPVPIEKKNDEKYKLLKMRQMKRKSCPQNKSVRKYEDIINSDYEKNLNTIRNYSNLKKKKMTQSTKKIYSSFIRFKDIKNDNHFFPSFSDKDIGIYEYWQTKIYETKNDEDIDTDDEQIKLAIFYCIGEIKEAFQYIIKNKKDSFINFNRFKIFQQIRK